MNARHAAAALAVALLCVAAADALLTPGRGGGASAAGGANSGTIDWGAQPAAAAGGDAWVKDAATHDPETHRARPAAPAQPPPPPEVPVPQDDQFRPSMTASTPEPNTIGRALNNNPTMTHVVDPNEPPPRPESRWIPIPELPPVDESAVDRALDLSMEQVMDLQKSTLSLDYSVGGREVKLEVGLQTDAAALVNERCGALGLHPAQCAALRKEAEDWQLSMQTAFAVEYALHNGGAQFKFRVRVSADDVHLQYVPLSLPRDAAAAAMREGLCGARPALGDATCAQIVDQGAQWFDKTQIAVEDWNNRTLTQMPAHTGFFVPGYWRTICPDLHVNADWGRAEWIRTGVVSDEELARVREQWLMYGTMSADIDFQMPTQMDKIFQCLGRLEKGNWPPVYIWMFDEAWMLASRLLLLVSRFMDLDVRPTGRFWGLYNRAGANSARFGFPPMRDHAWEEGKPPLDEHGMATTMTVMIPLNDVNVDNSAEYVLGKLHDPYHYQHAEEEGHPSNFRRLYGTRPWLMMVTKKARNAALLTNETRWDGGIGAFPELMQHVQAMEAKPGTVLGWDGEVLHWSAAPSALMQSRPRETGALYIEFQRGDVQKMGSGGVRMQESPPFFTRLQKCTDQLQYYRDVSKEVLDGFEWAARDKNINVLINVVKAALDGKVDYDYRGLGGAPGDEWEGDRDALVRGTGGSSSGSSGASGSSGSSGSSG